MIHFTTLSDLSLNIIFSRSIPIIDFRSERLHQTRNPISLAVLLKPATVKQKINLIDRSMAKLPDPVISNIFIIQRRIIECLDSTTATEFRLFERMGETAETLPELEELQNITEKLRSKYSRLYNLLLRIAESQPIASEDMLVLLYRSIDSTEASIDASIASLQEIQRNWN